MGIVRARDDSCNLLHPLLCPLKDGIDQSERGGRWQNDTSHQQALGGVETGVLVPLAGHGYDVEHDCRRTAAVNGGKRRRESFQEEDGSPIFILLSQAFDFGFECGDQPCASLVVAGWRSTAFARSPHQVVAERRVEGTLRLRYVVERHRSRDVGAAVGIPARGGHQ